jgi:hypothetical protein
MGPTLHPLDDDSASRLLQGLVHPDDAPPGYASVAGLLASAAQLPPADEHAGEATISAMVEVIRAGAVVPRTQAPQTGRKSKLGKIFAGKALVAMATVALTATGAAAGTGTLPDSVQNVVAGAVSHVGVNIPQPNHGKSAGHRQDGNHPQPGDKGQSGADHGQPAGDDGAGNSGDHGKGETISGITHDPALDGQPKGPTVCKEASDDRCQAGQNPGQGDGSDGDEGTPPVPVGSGEDHGKKPEATPPVTTGSTATGAERSGRDVGPSGKGDSGRD